jgi:transposase InsO family protein
MAHRRGHRSVARRHARLLAVHHLVCDARRHSFRESDYGAVSGRPTHIPLPKLVTHTRRALPRILADGVFWRNSGC